MCVRVCMRVRSVRRLRGVVDGGECGAQLKRVREERTKEKERERKRVSCQVASWHGAHNGYLLARCANSEGKTIQTLAFFRSCPRYDSRYDCADRENIILEKIFTQYRCIISRLLFRFFLRNWNQYILVNLHLLVVAKFISVFIRRNVTTDIRFEILYVNNPKFIIRKIKFSKYSNHRFYYYFNYCIKFRIFENWRDKVVTTFPILRAKFSEEYNYTRSMI